MNSKQVHLLGWGTLLGFGILGLLLNSYLNDANLFSPLSFRDSSFLGIVIGLLYGFSVAYASSLITEGPKLKEACRKYTDKIHALNLSFPQCIFLSFCAGVGEELFFRVALQPQFGLWGTSILFVAIHGYLNPRSYIFVYGLLLVFIVAGMGFLYIKFDFWSAAAAHFAYDLFLFKEIIKEGKSSHTFFEE
ncbi:MAG: CPBP family intramembrane metalloprotease [Lentisphaeraceae bacterium]|nr:CPBP family intramembrane metalloprotease [Lentisphaeraceae bacterium]